MNRATFLTTLAGGALSLRCLAREETPDEKAVNDLLDAAVDAQFAYDYVQPSNLTFRREQGQWLIYSSFLSGRVADLWWYRLSKPKDAEQQSK